MCPGLLPMVLWFVPHADPLSPVLRGIMAAVVLVLGGAIFVRYRKIERSRADFNRAGAVFGYAGSVLLTLLLFPAHAELGLTVLAVLAFGDGSATLGGKAIGGAKLPWNHEKTVSGLVSFMIVGIPVASAFYWGEVYFNPESASPPVGWSTALLCGGSATVAAAIAESIPSRINDNIRVGVTAAVVVVAVHAVTVGF